MLYPGPCKKGAAEMLKVLNFRYSLLTGMDLMRTYD